MSSFLRVFNRERFEGRAPLLDDEAGQGLAGFIEGGQGESLPIRHGRGSLGGRADPHKIRAGIALHREPGFGAAEAEGLRNEPALGRAKQRKCAIPRSRRLPIRRADQGGIADASARRGEFRGPFRRPGRERGAKRRLLAKALRRLVGDLVARADGAGLRKRGILAREDFQLVRFKIIVFCLGVEGAPPASPSATPP